MPEFRVVIEGELDPEHVERLNQVVQEAVLGELANLELVDAFEPRRAPEQLQGLIREIPGWPPWWWLGLWLRRGEPE